MNSHALQPGQLAPDFALRSTPDQFVNLSDFRGNPVILAFYPADWSPVCGDQLALYNELLPEFAKFGATLLAVSVDGVWCHVAFSQDRSFRFPLLSDFEPKGEVASVYGVYRAEEGTAERALFVIDSQGLIVWSYVSPVGVNPGADGILRALQSLGHRESNTDLTLPVSERDHSWGNSDADVTIVEYGDYECPHCGAAHPVVKQLLEHLGEEVRFVFRNFPLTQIHAHAEPAAEAAEVAADHGLFWEMHDLIFENQNRLDNRSLAAYAGSLGIEESDFLNKISQHEKLARIKEDFMSGVESGVNGTPTFFINGRRHEGANDFASLLAAAKSELS